MDYTKLKVWQFSRTLVGAVYEMTATFPRAEVFGLSSQMRRAAVSVPSNIAEECGRKTPNDIVRFLLFARRSLFEIETQCFLAFDLKYIKEEEFKTIYELLQSCKRLLNGFINHYLKI